MTGACADSHNEGTQALAPIIPSAHLADVRYEIRGALTRRARELESAGHDIIKLNIGNPGRYGFEAPAHLREAIAAHLRDSEAYGHEQGLDEAREAIAGRSLYFEDSAPIASNRTVSVQSSSSQPPANMMSCLPYWIAS